MVSWLICMDKTDVGLTELLEFEDKEIKKSKLNISNYSQIRFAKGENNIMLMATDYINQQIVVSFIEHNSIKNCDFSVI